MIILKKEMENNVKGTNDDYLGGNMDKIKVSNDQLIDDILKMISQDTQGTINKKALPDKWDILAAIFIAATVSVSVVGIVWCVSYIITSYITTTMVVSTISNILSSETKMKMATKLQKFIQTNMIWLLTQSVPEVSLNALSDMIKLHSKTKTFLINHFGTLDEFEMFLLKE
jgi:hypothetical protein